MKIAIIGSGVSGLSAAYLLNNSGHQITVFEKNDYIGGHARTIDISHQGKKNAVDTGFIVFNYRNYPLLTGLFNHLQVTVEKSDMSFGASIENGWFEYGTQNLKALIAQKRNFFRWQFYKMIFDILKFNRNAKFFLDSNITLGECLKKLNIGRWFKEYYLLAMGGSIWSTPTTGMLDFPARTFIRFFDNHGLITINDQPQWYTVTGGSKEYIKKITNDFRDKILIKKLVKKIVRNENQVLVYDEQNNFYEFDKVIFACHSDQALKIIENPSEDEVSILSSIKYQTNKIIVHSDSNFMPKNKSAWASWVYLNNAKNDDKKNVCLSYWMNRLQNIDVDFPIIVTLNSELRPESSKIFDEYTFEHPVFDEGAIQAQEKIYMIQGKNNSYFCGAYLKYGFHEDGFASGVSVAEMLGANIPWK
jgi:predicted NAD/FAD-binding protein